MNFFDLPVEIRQSIYNININEKCIILKNENEKNKNELLEQLNTYIKKYKEDDDFIFYTFIKWIIEYHYYYLIFPISQKELDEMYTEMY